MYPPTTELALRDHCHDYADAIRAIDALAAIDTPNARTMRLEYEAHRDTTRGYIAAIYYEHHTDA